MAWNVCVPETRDWDTVQECTENDPNTVYGYNNGHNRAENAHFLGWEDVEILDDDGGFGGDHGGVVEWGAEPMELIFDQCAPIFICLEIRFCLPSFAGYDPMDQFLIHAYPRHR